MCEDRRIFAARCADSNAIAALEEVVRDNGVVDLGFKDVEEAFFADLLCCFGAS